MTDQATGATLLIQGVARVVRVRQRTRPWYGTSAMWLRRRPAHQNQQLCRQQRWRPRPRRFVCGHSLTGQCKKNATRTSVERRLIVFACRRGITKMRPWKGVHHRMTDQAIGATFEPESCTGGTSEAADSSLVWDKCGVASTT